MGRLLKMSRGRQGGLRGAPVWAAQVSLLVALLATVCLLMAGASLGCRPRGPQPTMEGARQFTDAFMQERMTGEVAAARARLSDQARDIYQRPEGLVLDLQAIGDVTGAYPVAQVAESRDTFKITYRIQEVAGEVVYAAFWDEVLTVTGRGQTYQITAVGRGVLHEAYVSGDAVVLHIGDQESTLFELADLPDVFTPLGAPADVEFGVAKEGFILLSFAPAGNRLAFVTWGTHGFLGLANVPMGQPAGLDLHYGGLAIDVRWADDGRHLAAVVDAATGNRALLVYGTDPAERINLGLELQFAPEEYEVYRPRWTGAGELTFEVRTAGGGTDPITGGYRANISTREVSRLLQQ